MRRKKILYLGDHGDQYIVVLFKYPKIDFSMLLLVTYIDVNFDKWKMEVLRQFKILCVLFCIGVFAASNNEI
jgi:hypothetical protein